ncbi:unnamed protein product [Polarella glacialis]|uniref:Uncharacterized protein n=2 Tax=Polarella glacialis TaxID=89957 RepID=A0A813LCF1_POLGL|nr:unnamed protein product [Polarella glacialis]
MEMPLGQRTRRCYHHNDDSHSQKIHEQHLENSTCDDTFRRQSSSSSSRGLCLHNGRRNAGCRADGGRFSVLRPVLRPVSLRLLMLLAVTSRISGGGLAERGVVPGEIAFAAPGRRPADKRVSPATDRSDKRKALAAERLQAAALEEEFLQINSQGVGGGVDALALADQLAKLRIWPMAERKRLLAGDWRLHASEAGDLLVQLGSGLHGMPFTEMKDFFLNLRPASRELRAVEVLSVGPMKAPTVLKAACIAVRSLHRLLSLCCPCSTSRRRLLGQIVNLEA